MKNLKCAVYKIWLVLGLVQVALLAGCNGTATGDQLLSEDAVDATEQSQAGGQASESATFSPSSSVVRISRAFFEKSVTGSVKLGTDSIDSDVSWAELPPRGDDHLGCAAYDQTGGVQLCFKIQYDVSSLGVNERDVSVVGLCGGQYRNVKFTDGEYKDGVLKVHFVGTCQGQRLPAELSLRQI